MKKISILILLLLAAAACRKEVVPSFPEVSGDPIVFKIPETKGADALSDLVSLSEQDFGVSAWYTPDSDVFGVRSQSYIQNHRFGTLSNDPENDPNVVWQGISSVGERAADPVYYPLDGTLSYFCYAPYREDVSALSDVSIDYQPSGTITDRLANYLPYSPLFTFTPNTLPASQIDFIVAEPILDARKSNSAIPLDFSGHILTNIQFACKYVGDLAVTEGVVISQIIIRNVIGSEYLYFTESAGVRGFSWCSTISPEDGSATMPLSSYTLTRSDLISSGAYLTTDTYTHVNATIPGRLYLLPQTLPDDAQLEVTYVVKNRDSGASLDENVLVFPLRGTTNWPLGKTVQYKLTIGVADRAQVNILTANIVDWAPSGNVHSSEELMYLE